MILICVSCRWSSACPRCCRDAVFWSMCVETCRSPLKWIWTLSLKPPVATSERIWARSVEKRRCRPCDSRRCGHWASVLTAEASCCWRCCSGGSERAGVDVVDVVVVVQGGARDPVSMQHFMHALRIVQPSCLRSSIGATDFKPISWEQIGGLDHVKLKLKQVLQILPTRASRRDFAETYSWSNIFCWSWIRAARLIVKRSRSRLYHPCDPISQWQRFSCVY